MTYVISDSVTMLQRNLLHIVRYPGLSVFTILGPVVILLLTVFVFGGTLGAGLPGVEAGGGRDAYLAYVMPGILIITIAGTVSGVAITVAMDMTEGITARFRTMAISRAAVLTGHVIGNTIQAVIAVALVLGVGVLVGFRPTATPLEWLAAARQFQRYVAPGNTFRYKAGQVNAIQWHPNANCGASEVYIVNNATAALYNYTPYRPNQAALNNLGGTGDACSSYGNRNFWKFFTDWFGSTTVPKAASAFVKALYNDVLGREAGATEVHGWGMLVTNGRAPVDVAAGFVDSDEYRNIRINSAYQTILGRAAEDGGTYGWLVNMKNGLLTTDDVDKVFLATEEYLVNTGGTNESFVAALYQRLIGRAAAPEEVSGWAAIAAGQGRHVVVNSIWSSVETAQSRVSLMYASYLGRAPEPAGVAGWAQIAIERGDAGVRWAIIGSAEYWGRASARFPNG